MATIHIESGLFASGTFVDCTVQFEDGHVMPFESVFGEESDAGEAIEPVFFSPAGSLTSEDTKMHPPFEVFIGTDVEGR